MVYCHNCGTKNDDDAEFCSKCGEPLKDVSDYEGRSRPRHHDDRYSRQREECFGLPHGNIIAPLIFGIILILVGLSSIYGFEVWRVLWPSIIIIVGILIVIGAIYSTRKGR